MIANIKNIPHAKNLVESHTYTGKCPMLDQILYAFHRRLEHVSDRCIMSAFYASKQFVQEETYMSG